MRPACPEGAHLLAALARRPISAGSNRGAGAGELGAGAGAGAGTRDKEATAKGKVGAAVRAK
jgi:hypothetical protein